ncbi:MAG: transporter [Bacteroidota bacterium]
MIQKYALLFFMLPFYMLAQKPIETDRPDQTETAAIVPTGMFQSETGFLHKKTAPHASEFQLPETLWKFGLNEHLELRLITTLLYSKAADSSALGLDPVTIGLKVNLLKEHGLLPETSLIVHMQLPKVATKKFQSEYLTPEIRLLFQNKVSSSLDLGYNLGVSWDGETPQPEYAYTISPDFKLSSTISAYIEAFGYLPSHKHADHWIDGGLKYLITKNVQLDISGGYELSSHQTHQQFYEALGVSLRI